MMTHALPRRRLALAALSLAVLALHLGLLDGGVAPDRPDPPGPAASGVAWAGPVLTLAPPAPPRSDEAALPPTARDARPDPARAAPDADPPAPPPRPAPARAGRAAAVSVPPDPTAPRETTGPAPLPADAGDGVPGRPSRDSLPAAPASTQVLADRPAASAAPQLLAPWGGQGAGPRPEARAVPGAASAAGATGPAAGAAPAPEPPAQAAVPAAPAAPEPPVAQGVHAAEPDAEATRLAAGPARAAGPAPRALPPMPWRLPPPIDWRYRLSRSGVVGEGRLRWEPAEGRYRLRLEGELPLIGPLIVQTSEGGFDAAGLAPRRFTDRRLRRPEQAANFIRPPGGPATVQFSGPSDVHTLPAGSQDRLSVLIQVAALASAWKAPPAQPFTVPVVGARGDLSAWTLRVVGVETVRPIGAAPVAALKLERVTEDPHDTRVELWLDPGAGHLPLRVRLSDGRGDPLDLLRHP